MSTKRTSPAPNCSNANHYDGPLCFIHDINMRELARGLPGILLHASRSVFDSCRSTGVAQESTRNDSRQFVSQQALKPEVGDNTYSAAHHISSDEASSQNSDSTLIGDASNSEPNSPSSACNLVDTEEDHQCVDTLSSSSIIDEEGSRAPSSPCITKLENE